MPPAGGMSSPRAADVRERPGTYTYQVAANVFVLLYKHKMELKYPEGARIDR